MTPNLSDYLPSALGTKIRSGVHMKFKWSPQEDITTFELAQCIGLLIAQMQKYATLEKLQREYDKLPANAQRHWEKVEG